MTSPEPSNPVVYKLVAVINDGDRDAFLATLRPDATLTDDGNPRSLHDWIDREIFSVNGHMTVEREDEDGLYLLARYLFAELLGRGWTETDCAALAGGNLLRALRQAESLAVSVSGRARA